MRITWITHCYPKPRPDGTLTSDLASLRYRVLSPIHGLNFTRYEHKIVVNTPTTSPLPWDTALDADVLVFSKSFTDSNEELARGASARGIPVVFDVCDNHYETPEFARHYREMSALADQVTCNGAEMAKAAEPYCRAPPVVIEDPYEGARQPPRYAPGERLRMLWFGNPTNLDSLWEALPDVVQYARERRPISLTLLTQMNPTLQGTCERATAAHAPFFDITPHPWSLERQWRELAACDAVILPTLQNPHKRVKSANRLIETLWAGRPAVAQPIPAYLPFARWTPVRETMAEGLEWLEAHRAEAPGLISAAQRHIEAHYAPALLARNWEQVIHATRSRQARAE